MSPSSSIASHDTRTVPTRATSPGSPPFDVGLGPLPTVSTTTFSTRGAAADDTRSASTAPVATSTIRTPATADRAIDIGANMSKGDDGTISAPLQLSRLVLVRTPIAARGAPAWSSSSNRTSPSESLAVGSSSGTWNTGLSDTWRVAWSISPQMPSMVPGASLAAGRARPRRRRCRLCTAPRRLSGTCCRSSQRPMPTS